MCDKGTKPYATINGDPDTTMKNFSTDNVTDNALDILSDSRDTSRYSDKDSRGDKGGNIALVTVSGDKNSCVYGNDLRNKNPYRMGGYITFLFYKGQPIICIGPRCNVFN